MKKYLMSLTAAVLLSGAALSANAVLLVYSVSVDNGVSFGVSNPKTTFSSLGPGNSFLQTTPRSGFLNLNAGSVDLDVDTELRLETPFVTPVAGETITENFQYNIRVGLASTGNVADLETMSGGFAAAGTFVEFEQDGMFMLSNIGFGSVTGVFTPPLGGSFGNIPGAPSQTLALAGAGNLTLRNITFDLPGAPQPDLFNPGVFVGFGAITDRLSGVPEPGSVAMLAGLMVGGSALVLRRRRK